MIQTAADHICIIVPVGQQLSERQDIDLVVPRPGHAPLSVKVRLEPEPITVEPTTSVLPTRSWKTQDDLYPAEYGGGD